MSGTVAVPDAAATSSGDVQAPVPRSTRSFIWTQVTYLVGNMPGLVALLAVASVLTGFAEAGILAILAQAALLLVKGASRTQVSLGPVHLHPTLAGLLAIGVLLAFVRLGLQIIIAFGPARISDNAQARLRSELFAAFTRASWTQQSRDREGQLQELVTNQAAQATQTFTVTASLVVALLTFLVLVSSALVLSPLAAVVILVVAVALSALLRPLARVGNRRAAAVSGGLIHYAAGVSESVRLAEEAHVFGVGASQRERNDKLIGAFRRPNFHALFLNYLVPGAYQSLIYLLLILALVGLYVTGTGHVASLGAVVLLLVRSGAYGQQVQNCVQALRQTQPYLERLEEAKRRYSESEPVDGSRPLGKVNTLAFADVSFSYEPSRTVLEDIDFTVRAGEAIGIMGPSGAGKSTVVQLLLGLRSPTGGRYLVNGVPAETFSRQDWRRAFAYVPQEARMLHASVADNIRFFRDIDQASVERAARLAGIHADIMSWPGRYETTVGPRADAISGGQQQRICLARALASRPEVLVLDEPTSALDPRAEQLIQGSLLGLKDKITLFVVAHRTSTLDICERVMVIVDGRLDAFDRTAELQSSSGYYRSAVGGSVLGGSH